MWCCSKTESRTASRSFEPPSGSSSSAGARGSVRRHQPATGRLLGAHATPPGLSSRFNEAMAQAILEERGATIRVLALSLRPIPVTAAVLLHLAIPGTFLSGRAPSIAWSNTCRLQALRLALPAGAVVPDQKSEICRCRRPRRQERPASAIPKPWPLVGATTALGDSAAGPAKAVRALVIFSSGVDGASPITPQDLADQAVASGVAVYPVMDATPHTIIVAAQPEKVGT